MSSKVYFIKAALDEGCQTISEKAHKLFNTGKFASCFSKDDFTAVKVHVGEAGNNTYLPADCIKDLIAELLKLKTKPFLTDTSTLYTGRRHNAIDHTTLAAEHGFCCESLGIPFIVPDGLFGTSETTIEINCPLNKHVFVAYDIARCQSILSIAHFTGHVAASAAATIKTIGMGCSSRKGKLRQHSAIKPSIKEACTLCGECLKHCPADAIGLNKTKANIDQDKCIGCAECFAVCRFNAVEYDWKTESKTLQQNIAEHAFGVLKDKKDKAVFFNFLISIAEDCDCFSTPDIKKIVDDIGILASTDPVAIDKASIDLIEQKGQKKLPQLVGNDKLNPSHQLQHAERIGLGTGKYELIEIG